MSFEYKADLLLNNHSFILSHIQWTTGASICSCFFTTALATEIVTHNLINKTTHQTTTTHPTSCSTGPGSLLIFLNCAKKSLGSGAQVMLTQVPYCQKMVTDHSLVCTFPQASVTKKICCHTIYSKQELASYLYCVRQALSK